MGIVLILKELFANLLALFQIISNDILIYFFSRIPRCIFSVFYSLYIKKKASYKNLESKILA